MGKTSRVSKHRGHRGKQSGLYETTYIGFQCSSSAFLCTANHSFLCTAQRFFKLLQSRKAVLRSPRFPVSPFLRVSASPREAGLLVEGDQSGYKTFQSCDKTFQSCDKRGSIMRQNVSKVDCLPCWRVSHNIFSIEHLPHSEMFNAQEKRYVRLKNCAAGKCSAGFQPAVSPTSSRQGLHCCERPQSQGTFGGLEARDTVPTGREKSALHSARCIQRVHVSKCTAGVPPARGRLAERRDEGGRDARGTLWATHLLTCTRIQPVTSLSLDVVRRSVSLMSALRNNGS